MLSRLAEAEDRALFLERCLDDLLALFGADRALVLLHHEDGSVSCPCSRSRGRALEESERAAISRSITRRAVESGACVVSRPLEEVDASDSMVWKGIHLAMAAPMRAARGANAQSSQTVGVLYVDFRDKRRAATEHEQTFLENMAHVLGAVLVPYGKLERVQTELREISALSTPEAPSLEQLVRHDSMREVRRELASAITSDAPILITGESGTGKTQLARAIALASGRTPIVRAVLGSSDDLNTITSELFGHERGSFSGALSKRTGLVELSDGGTLIFDEILNLPPSAQQLLLDFTQFGSYRPLGYDRREPKQGKVRIIAATNGDLMREMRERRFREDLYYRLAAVVIELPPLRARLSDVPDLAEAILSRHRLHGGAPLRLSSSARAFLSRTDWTIPGNVRQLEAATKRARDRALADGEREEVHERHFSSRDLIGPALSETPGAGAVAAPGSAPAKPASSWADLQAERRSLEERERLVVAEALERHRGVIAHAAKQLGVARTTLASRLESLGIDRPPKRRR